VEDGEEGEGKGECAGDESAEEGDEGGVKVGVGEYGDDEGNACDLVEEAREGGVEEEEDKVLVILEANTVVHPRTVMIHLEDAFTADRTMMSSQRFGLSLTPCAHSDGLFRMLLTVLGVVIDRWRVVSD